MNDDRRPGADPDPDPDPAELEAEPDPAAVAAVRSRLAAVRARIADAGGDPATVTVLAVTKGHPRSVVALALAAGLSDLGENYAQELVAKARSHGGAVGPAAGVAAPTSSVTGPTPVAAAPSWHFIGHLQRNKVRQLAPFVTVWQSIDRPELVVELARRAPGARLLVQVNATGEPQKAGCPPERTAELVQAARDAALRVEGLMTVGPTDDAVDARPGFELVRGLVDELGLTVCSMGMTDDLELAVAAGSTMVRVGTALFGPRSLRPSVGN